MTVVALERPWRLQEFTTAGTFSFVVPDGVTKLIAMLIGGGGAGASGIFTAASGTGYGVRSAGGSAAQVVLGIPIIVTPGETLTVIVGAGGIGGLGTSVVISGNPGSPGSPSIIKRSSQVLATALGGLGGTPAPSTAAYGIPGATILPGGPAAGADNFSPIAFDFLGGQILHNTPAATAAASPVCSRTLFQLTGLPKEGATSPANYGVTAAGGAPGAVGWPGLAAVQGTAGDPCNYIDALTETAGGAAGDDGGGGGAGAPVGYSTTTTNNAYPGNGGKGGTPAGYGAGGSAGGNAHRNTNNAKSQVAFGGDGGDGARGFVRLEWQV